MSNNNTRFGIKKIYLNLIYTLIIGGVLFFLALYVSFMLSRFLPGDPVLAYLPEGHVDPNLYMQVYRQLGLDKPLIEQFFIYLGKMFTGNWGISISIVRGMPVWNLIQLILPRTIDLFILPFLIGISLGLLFGNLSVKFRHKWSDKLFQILTFIGCALPLFFLGMLFQYFLGYLLPIFPTTGFKTYSYPDPPFVTGFRIIDSLLSRQLYLIPDYLYHLVLPWSVLTIGIGSLTTLMVRIYLLNLNKSKTRSIVPNSFNSVISIGLFFGFIILVETTFGLAGIGQLFVQSIRNSDYWVHSGILFLSAMISVIFLVLSNLLFVGYGALKPRLKNKITSRHSDIKEANQKSSNLKSKINSTNTVNINYKNKLKKQFKDFLSYFNKKLLSPLTIISSMILLFLVLISIFPQILTPYSLEDANGVFPGAWSPPSPLHPLGQTKFGRDVLARTIYGMRTSFIFVLIPIGIGFIGGLLCGIPMGLLNRKFKLSTEISMIVFFCIPLFFGILTTIAILWTRFLMFPIVYGIFLIPFFSLLIAKTRLNGFEITKKVIPYIPLFIGFVLIVDAGIDFLGFSDPRIISLAGDISVAREFLYIVPLATFFPGFIIILLVIGFFLLYAGLQRK
ncbi:MAG: hypothetical protein ACFFFB_13060 [Candidatus Heimdallarchaeota archaeon]